MNESLSNSELLCAFVDGELDSTETGSLFYAIAQSQELQAELRQLITLRSALQGELIQAPRQLKNSVMGMVGLASEAQGTSLSSSLIKFFSGKAGVILSAAGASLLTALFFLYGMKPENHLASSIIPEKAPVQVMELPNPVVRRNIERQTGQSLLQRRKSYALPLIDPSTQEKLESPAPVLLSSSLPQPILMVEQSDVKHYGMQQPRDLQTSNPKPIAIPDVHMLPVVDKSSDNGFRLQFRGFSARSFPHPDIASPADPLINSVAGAVLYDLSDHHSFGLEIGQENFLQEFDGRQDNTRIFYRQNYLGLWAGAVYQYSFESIQPLAGMQPFLRGTIGGNRTGPMGRAIVGMQFRSGSLSSLFGAEGTFLLYRYQQQWFATRKIGITYGLSFHF